MWGEQKEQIAAPLTMGKVLHEKNSLGPGLHMLHVPKLPSTLFCALGSSSQPVMAEPSLDAVQ
jgi:hypothetical protein